MYQEVLTPTLFCLMDTCHQIQTEGLIELKGRIQRLGIPCPDNWGVLECKQAYLWHFGEPEMIFERKVIANYLSAHLSSRGVVFVHNNLQEASEYTFKDWRISSGNKRLIPLGGSSEKVNESDVILFVHRGRDYLLVRGKNCRLIDLTDMSKIDLGKATCCTVDAVSSANYLITYQYKSPGVGLVRWCDVSQLIKGEAQWRERFVDETPYELQLDVSQNQIVVLEMAPGECPGQQRGTINMESGEWVRLTDRPAHQPFWDSPIYRKRRQNNASDWVPITMKQVAIGGVPRYQWDLHKYGKFPQLELRRAINNHLMPQTIRALYKSIPRMSEVVTVQSAQNGCFPILNILYRTEQIFKCKTWRLIPPSEPFTELECSPSTTASRPSDIHEDKWGENVIIRALRVGDHWAWEPLMHLLRNRLIELLQNKEEDPHQQWLESWTMCSDILNAAALWNRPKFVKLFFDHFDRTLIYVLLINSIDELMPHLLTACKLGHLDVALSLLKCSALNIPFPNNRKDLEEWPPLKGAMFATYCFQWSVVIPLITAQECSQQDRITLYRHILDQHIKGEYRKEDPSGFAKMVVDLCNCEPALLGTTEALAAAAIIDNRDLIGRITDQAVIDLPSYNGDYSEWENIAYQESLTFHAIHSLEDHPEAMEWFIDWLVNRKLHERVEEALEVMRPQWHKRRRSESPSL
jgi:hypothetical protein